MAASGAGAGMTTVIRRIRSVSAINSMDGVGGRGVFREDRALSLLEQIARRLSLNSTLLMVYRESVFLSYPIHKMQPVSANSRQTTAGDGGWRS